MNRREILIRVLSGSATRKERKQLEQWLSSGSELLGLQDSEPGTADSGPTEQDLREIRRIIRAAKKRRAQRLLTLWLILSLFAMITAIVLLRSNQVRETLIFHNAEIRTVARTLEKSFGVSIDIVELQTQSCLFTGELYRIQSVEGALKIISDGTGLTWDTPASGSYRIKGNCNK